MPICLGELAEGGAALQSSRTRRWRPIGSGNGATQPRPYLRRVSVIADQPGRRLPARPVHAATMACTKSWYELPSLVNRLPFGVTAITPGLARSMKCGITPFEPSLRVVTDTGTQAAACGSVRVDPAADGFGQPQAVAGVAGRARRVSARCRSAHAGRAPCGARCRAGSRRRRGRRRGAP